MPNLCETPSPTPELSPEPERCVVRLVDGSDCDLSGLGREQLLQLQWEQEVAFAEQIKRSAKHSSERASTTEQAYETVCTILGAMSAHEGHSDFAMGMDSRYTDLVLSQLARLQEANSDGGLFEVGFGSGILLDAAAARGYRVGGLEVAEQLHRAASERVPEDSRDNLLFGAFVGHPGVKQMRESFSVVYWNDVFEHIPKDEIGDYLNEIYGLLAAGGVLISITPNWHMRPMDVTADHLPGRSEAIGFHLKEYKLSEVRRLLLDAGFSSVVTPSFVGKRKIFPSYLPGAIRVKCLVEPLLELLPYSLAVQVCRRLGFCCTIATK